MKSHANTFETNYAKHKVKNEEQAGACTDNGSMAVGSGARARGMGRRGGHGGESGLSRQRRKRDMSSCVCLSKKILQDLAHSAEW